MADLSGRIGDRDIDAGRVVLAGEKLGDVEATARDSRLDGGGLLRGEGVLAGLAAVISALLVVVVVWVVVGQVAIVCVDVGRGGDEDRGDGLFVFLVALLGFFSSEISINDE